MAIKTKADVPLNPLADRTAEDQKPQAIPTPVKPRRPNPPKTPVNHGKAEPDQGVNAVGKPGKRGRKPSEDPREKISFRLPTSLIAALDQSHPDWKAEIEPLLRQWSGHL